MRPLGYLFWLAGTAVGLAFLIVVFTVSIDPYRTFDTPLVPGWTELKPRATEQLDIAKVYQLERVAPETLILGNSRSEIGIDPASSEWLAEQRPVFNASEAGRGIFTSLLLLREALAVRTPKQIVVGLDFQDCLTERPAPVEETPFERRLMVDRAGHPNPARNYQVWKDRLASTLTIDAVLDSAETLIDQDAATSPTLTPFGFNPLHEYRILARRIGYHELFAAKAAEYRKQYGNYPPLDFSRPLEVPAFRHLQSLLKVVVQWRIPTVLYIHPYHAQYLEMLDELGLWSRFEGWKRAVVAAISREERDSPGTLRLFDFSGFNQFTTEPVPPAGDRQSAMRWYWEPGHYKSALGEHILATIFHEEKDFGRLLTPENIDSTLTEISRQRSLFADHFEAASQFREDKQESR